MSLQADVTPEATERRVRHARWLEHVAAAPYRYDFYQLLRRFEAAHPELPRLGLAARPADEPLRIAGSAELNFAPAPLRTVTLRGEAPPLVEQRIFGLLGPNGALPLHLTELARERQHHHADPTFKRFLDLLTHRLSLLFYRAWAEAQPVVSLDRRGDAPFARRLGSLTGLGLPAMAGRDALDDAAKLHFTGRLARQTRDAEGLLGWCRAQFDVPVRLQTWCGHWMPLAEAERTRLARGEQLGRGAVLGGSVWDVQHKFRLVVGPLRLARYHAFLPGGADLARLQAIVRHWVGIELAWDLRLVLDRRDVPPLALRREGAPMLGRTTWLGRRPHENDADDLVLDVESTLRRRPLRAKPLH